MPCLQWLAKNELKSIKVQTLVMMGDHDAIRTVHALWGAKPLKPFLNFSPRLGAFWFAAPSPTSVLALRNNLGHFENGQEHTNHHTAHNDPQENYEDWFD